MKKLIIAAIIVLALGAISNSADAATLICNGYYSTPPDKNIGPDRTIRIYLSPSYYIPQITDDEGTIYWNFTPPQYVDSLYCRLEDDTLVWVGVYNIKQTLTGSYHCDLYVYPSQWKPKK